MIIFLYLIEIIYCDPSSEQSHQDGSDEGSQHMFISRIKKDYPYRIYPAIRRVFVSLE